MERKLLDINLFGACLVRAHGGRGFEITGAKHKALFALLATAPFGRRTRAFLQQTLWGTACYDTGRQSLRRALSDIKHMMAGRFGELLTVTHSDVALDLNRIHFIGRLGRGEFLEGIDIREDGFNHWLDGIRQNPEQIQALFSLRSQPPSAPILPMITILPFPLVAGTPDCALLGDWLAEEICRSLSRSSLIGVISHLSGREFAKRAINVDDLRRSLGVDYCIVGSVRVIGGNVVLDADFLDASSGRILWTRRTAGSLASFLAAENPAVDEIVSAVGRTIADEAMALTRGREIASLADHHLLVAAVGLMHELRLAGFARSRLLIQEAIRRAPHSAEAHAWLGEWYLLSIFNGWSADPGADTARARDCTARALDLDPDNAFCLTIDGAIANNLLQRLDAADERFRRAKAVNPNESMTWLLSGVLCAYQDRGEEAIVAVEQARKLSPLDPFGYFYDSLSASAYLSAGEYERALSLADQSLARNRRHVSTLRARICALHHLDRGGEARAAGAELMRRQPGFSVSSYLASHPAAGYRFGRIHAEALRAAGVPE